jgi:transposase
MHADLESGLLVGEHGSLAAMENDEVTRKLAMLIEGECEGLGPSRAAEKFGFSRQRYFQLRDAFREHGAIALQSRRRGPKTNYRRTDELTRQVIRHRFLDPDASAEVIAQKLRQTGFKISTRSVDRVIAEYGLQKKTLSMPTSP